MNAGTPVIGTGQVGAAAAGAIDHRTNGFVVPERNITALAERVEQVLSNPELQSELGMVAQETIQNYNFEQMIKGFADAFTGLKLDGAVADATARDSDDE